MMIKKDFDRKKKLCNEFKIQLCAKKYRIKRKYIALRKQTNLTYSHCSSKHANISYIDDRREIAKINKAT